MTPDQADTLRDAINTCRETSRNLMLADRRTITKATRADDDALKKVNQLITELTNHA